MKNKSLVIGLVVLLLLVAGYFIWQNSNVKPPLEKEKVKVGVLLPLTGDAGSYGKSLKKGLELSIGNNTQYIFEDSKADPGTAVSAVNKLIDLDEVDVIVGDMFTHTTMAINPIVDKNEVLLITPTASASSLTETSSFTFRLYPSEKEEAEVISNFFNENLNTQAAIFVANEDAMLAVADIITNLSEDKVQNRIEFENDNQNFRIQLSRLSEDVETIFVLGYLEQSVLIIKQAVELGLDVNFCGLSTLYSPALGELILGVENDIYVPAPYFSESNQDTIYSNFNAEYYSRYSESPDVWSGYGYDAGNLVELIIKRSEISNRSLIDEMYDIANYKGVTGEITINSDRSINKQMQMKVFRDNKFGNVD